MIEPSEMTLADEPDAGAARHPRRAMLWSVLLLCAAIVTVYANSLNGPFIFDDLPAIQGNPTICNLTDWPRLLKPLAKSSVDGRPLVNITLAVNYAISGLYVQSYHLTNLLIHLIAALLLFAILRRAIAQIPGIPPARVLPLSLLIALLWGVHPLQTESVTYTVQRAESLMGLFFLLTLFAAIRAAASPHPFAWAALAVTACAAGMACKESMVVAPLVVLLYDRAFLGRSFRQALRSRWPLYAGLASTWLLLAYLIAHCQRAGDSAISGAPVPPAFDYALTQFQVIPHYLRLSVWPYPQCLDYFWPPVRHASQVIPGILFIGALIILSLFAWLKNRPVGFAGAWFFLTLAPTSSIMPIADPAFEHRMYLPLAAVMALLVIAAYRLSLRTNLSPSSLFAASLLLSLAFGARTIARNRDYQTELSIWTQTVAVSPDNSRAWGLCGNAYMNAGDLEQAFEAFSRSILLDPKYHPAFYNLGNLYLRLNEPDKARESFDRALAIAPEFTPALINRGVLEADAQHYTQAINYYSKALKSEPENYQALNNRAVAYSALHDYEKASDDLQACTRLGYQPAAGLKNKIEQGLKGAHK